MMLNNTNMNAVESLTFMERLNNAEGIAIIAAEKKNEIK
jgi:hypothetical protein